MYTFKTFITEDRKHFYFEHPDRGFYKVTHHPEQNVYHAHNKHGEVTHTFSGHMTPEDIVREMKKDPKMKYSGVMVTQEETLHETPKSDSARASASVNDSRGKYNEALIAHHLNGGKFIDDEHKKIHDTHKKILAAHDAKHGTNNVAEQQDRAKEQAKVFLDHAKKRGYSGVHEVHLTGKPGDIEKKTGIHATQQENPSDIIAKFHRKPKGAAHGYLGLSAKSSASKSIGFHNGGPKDAEELFKKHVKDTSTHDLGGHVAKRQKEFMTHHGLPAVRAQAERIVHQPKHNPDGTENKGHRNNDLYHKAQQHALATHTEIRDKLHKGYSEMAKNHHEELKHHLISTYIKGNSEQSLPYAKVHGQGGGHKPAKASATNPSDNDTSHSIHNAKRFSFHPGGESLLHVHAHETSDPKDKGKKIMTIQSRNVNGPLSNLRLAAS